MCTTTSFVKIFFIPDHRDRRVVPKQRARRPSHAHGDSESTEGIPLSPSHSARLWHLYGPRPPEPGHRGLHLQDEVSGSCSTFCQHFLIFSLYLIPNYPLAGTVTEDTISRVSMTTVVAVSSPRRTTALRLTSPPCRLIGRFSSQTPTTVQTRG